MSERRSYLKTFIGAITGAFIGVFASNKFFPAHVIHSGKIEMGDDWDYGDADIIEDIRAMKKAAMEQTGYEPVLNKDEFVILKKNISMKNLEQQMELYNFNTGERLSFTAEFPAPEFIVGQTVIMNLLLVRP